MAGTSFDCQVNLRRCFLIFTCRLEAVEYLLGVECTQVPAWGEVLVEEITMGL